MRVLCRIKRDDVALTIVEEVHVCVIDMYTNTFVPDEVFENDELCCTVGVCGVKGVCLDEVGAAQSKRGTMPECLALPHASAHQGNSSREGW
jgi:hypothetical protein